MSDRSGAAPARRARRTPRARGAVAVLGGTGLLGAEVARRCLAEGREVTVLSRHTPDDPTAEMLAGARQVRGDAADRTALAAALEGASDVVDALGAPHPAARVTGAERARELAVLEALVGELERRGGVALTFLSSGGTVYGDTDGRPVAEDAPCRPRSAYGATKLAAERRLVAAAEGGLSVRILRVANAYGARQRHSTGQGLVAAMLRAAATAAPLTVFGDGTSVRDYVDARDVADAVAGLLDEKGPRVLNVGTGVGHCVHDVADVVAAVTGRPLQLRHVAGRATDVAAVVLDVTALRAAIPWAPRDLREGVADAWAKVRASARPRRRAPIGAR